MKLILSCDHAGNIVPPNYEHLFMMDKDVLQTHKGYNIGTSDLCTYLEHLAAYSTQNHISRLVVEPSKSLRSPDLFSKFSRDLPQEERIKILDTIYRPYRNKVIEGIENCLAEGQIVFHMSLHSFTPVLKGEVRTADIGLLFDPKIPLEKALCLKLKANLNRLAPELRVRFNYPHAGITDGFTSFLRKQFSSDYAGIELELNQKLAPDNIMSQHLKNVLTIAISNALNQQ